MLKVVLGLGGNLGATPSVFSTALEGLASSGRLVSISRLWKTRPVGPEQPEFLNAAVLIHWPEGPRSLLGRCRQLEIEAGRRRQTEERWGPRVLDLDLLLGDGFVCVGPGLEVPHPRFHQRRFALEPAAEAAPGWTHPFLGRSVADLAAVAREREPDAILEVQDFDPGHFVH